jgi:Fe/S biogenesis protein NfuA
MLTFTDRAREMVRTFMDQGEGELEALRIGVEGSPVAPRYELTLVARTDRRDDEREVDLGDFAVLVAEESVDRLNGATVDFVERVNESGFEVRPQGGAAVPSGGPTGPLADRVREVLDAQVNPAIAAHGGQINLVDVQSTEIFLEMSGGCQGCALSRMTLRQGVEKMLRQSVPEITAVHDVTDHAGGQNPYFNGEV